MVEKARYMRLRQAGPGLFKVSAVLTVPKGWTGATADLVEAPPGKSDRELFGMVINTKTGQPFSRPKGKWSFVIPTYSGAKMEKCLQSLRSCHDGLMDFEVIVSFDGGPNPSWIERMAKRYGAAFVGSKTNDGFAKAVNRGLRACDPESAGAILTNDDIEFAMPAGACMAWTLEQKPDIGMVGTLLLYPDGQVQHAGKNSAGCHIGKGRPPMPADFEDREVMGVTGALLGIPRRFLEQVGRLDERYRMAWDDADLGLTASTLGWKVWYCGQVWAYHDEGMTRGADVDFKRKKHPTWMAWEDQSQDEFEAKWGRDLATEEWKTKPRRSLLKRLVVKRTTAYGDVLLTTPVVHALRQKRPDWEIAVATDHGFIYRDNPDATFVLPTKHPWVTEGECEEFYDLDLSYESAPELGIMEAYAKICDVDLADPWPRVFIRDSERAWARERLGKGSWAVVHPGPKGWPGGDWAFERFSEVAHRLRKRRKVVLVGNGPMVPIPNDLDLRHQTTYHQLAAVIERADLFVGIDSMPLHLSQAFRKPTVGVFGCIDPDHVLVKAPFIKGVTADPQTVDCLGCHHRRSPPRTSGLCDRDRIHCMDELGVERVWSAIQEALKGA